MRRPSVNMDEPEQVLHLLKELDSLRDQEAFRVLMSSVLMFDDPELWEFCRALQHDHEGVVSVSFASLTEEQRATLRGPDIGLALDELRLQRCGWKRADSFD